MNNYVNKTLGLLAICCFLASCSVNPVTGKKELMLMSESQEIALGQQSDPAIMAQYGAYDDAELQAFINAEGQKMAKISHRPQLDWEFKIVDSPVVNAFAVPGGYVYFTRGIMAHFNNKAEFAGVLGHEIGHVTARHSAQQQTKAQIAQVAFIGGVIFSPAIRGMAQETQQALGLLLMKYGRDAESQSDQLGVEYSTKIGYDSHEMADFFKTLSRLSEKSGANQIPTFMSTHPNPLDRFEKVHEASKEWQAKDPQTSYDVERDSYLALIDGIVYGEDPRQGYVDRNVFYHPELKFSFPVPANHQLINSPAQVQMVPEDGKSAIIFTLSQQKTIALAANELQEQTKWQIVDQQNTNVNGLPARAMIADIVQQAQDGTQSTLRIMTYLIEYGGNVYIFHGLADVKDFDSRFSAMKSTATGFKKLTDASKINVKPERIDIVKVSSASTLGQALGQNGIPSARLSEFAILNGMELNERLAAGSKIKVIERGTLRN